MGEGLGPMGPLWTCTNLFTWGLRPPRLLKFVHLGPPHLPSADMFHADHFGKRAVGLRLKGLLLDHSKFGVEIQFVVFVMKMKNVNVNI